MFPLDTIANTPQDWSFGKPFLVRVEAAAADEVQVSEPKEYEVIAESVDEACRKAAGQSPWMRSDVQRRTTLEFRTENYIEPDWNAYAGGSNPSRLPRSRSRSTRRSQARTGTTAYVTWRACSGACAST